MDWPLWNHGGAWQQAQSQSCRAPLPRIGAARGGRNSPSVDLHPETLLLHRLGRAGNARDVAQAVSVPDANRVQVAWATREAAVRIGAPSGAHPGGKRPLRRFHTTDTTGVVAHQRRRRGRARGGAARRVPLNPASIGF